MQYYNRIDVSKGIDVNKTSASKECIICHYCYFLNKGFRFKVTICKGIHDVLMMSIDITDVLFFKLAKVKPRIYFEKADLSEKSRHLHNIKNNFFSSSL